MGPIDSRWLGEALARQSGSFFGEEVDRVGGLADPKLAAVVAKGRQQDAVSIKQLDLVRKRRWAALASIFVQQGALLSPTMTRLAVGVEEDDARYHVISNDGRKHGLNMISVYNWVPWCPSLSVPSGLSNQGLPIGIHSAAAAYREDVLLRAAGAIEASHPRIWPRLWRPPRDAITKLELKRDAGSPQGFGNYLGSASADISAMT